MKVKTLYELPCEIKNPAISSLVYKTNKVLVNVFYPLFVRYEYGLDEKSNVIVSLTTFPERIGTVWLTVSTLLNQTVKPWKIILWLAEEQFPEGEKALPRKLLELKKYGLEIRFCENLYPHKKYYYTMKEYPEATVITVDDDIFYPENLIELLENISKKYPKAICCTWAHEMNFDTKGEIAPYTEWQFGIDGDREPSKCLIPIGCGGVLYPAKALHPDVFNKEKIKELCLKTDDLWLKCMAVKNHRPAVRVDRPARIYFNILKTQVSGLHAENVGENKNDDAMKKIISAYPEVLENLKR